MPCPDRRDDSASRFEQARNRAMNAMNYKGYFARIEFDAEDKVVVGHIAGINDVVGFHADNVADLTAAFHEAVDNYLEACEKSSKAPKNPIPAR
jgi:predicted HicB family RNase H-like nuclease